jgi:hypothetical protein
LPAGAGGLKGWSKMKLNEQSAQAPWNKSQVEPKGFDYREGEIDANAQSSLSLRLPWPPSGNRQNKVMEHKQ